MAITAAMVKELREMTGAGMMDCKKALAATEGNMEAAVDFLREKGLATAQKKASRIAAEGIVVTKLTDDAKTEDTINNWKFKTDFWRTYGSAGDDERPEIPDPDSEYLELQLYLKSDDIMESSVTETYNLDDDTYAEEGKVYDVADDSEWKAVGAKIRINIR